jgi:heme exporter protein A
MRTSDESLLLEGAQLACRRGEQSLFEGLDLRVASGECLHVRGANGAGKTSLLRQVAGLSTPTAGEVRWNATAIGACRDAYRSALVYVGHAAGTKGELSALENLRFAAALDGVELDEDDAAAALDRVGLGGREDLPVRDMSQGQRRRVALSRLVWRKAPLWVLDEPLTALDAPAVDLLGALLQSHVDQGGLVVMTSHQPLPVRAAHVVEL